MNASVSILIPVHNGINFIGECIHSVLLSKYPNLKIIISDNFSNDGTGNFIKTFNDPRIKIISPIKKLTAQSNFNFLISNSDSDFFLLLPHDDLLLKNAIENLITPMIEDNDLLFTFGLHNKISEDRRVLVNFRLKHYGNFYGINALTYIFSNFTPFQHALVRKISCLNIKSPYSNYYGNLADVFFYCFLASKSGFKVINKECTSLRCHSNQGQNLVSQLHKSNYSGVIKHHGNHNYKNLQLRGNKILVLTRLICYLKKNRLMNINLGFGLSRIYIFYFMQQAKKAVVYRDLLIVNCLFLSLKKLMFLRYSMRI